MKELENLIGVEKHSPKKIETNYNDEKMNSLNLSSEKKSQNFSDDEIKM